MKFKNKISKLFKDGFFHIVGAGTINKIISLCSGIIIVRVMTQLEYGTYSHVMNTVNMFLIANGLGSLTGVLQYGCENRENTLIRNSIIHYGMKIGFLFNIACGFVVLIYGICFKQPIDNAALLFSLAAFIPALTYICDGYSNILRIGECNREYGYYSIINSLLVFSSILTGAICFSVSGAIAFRYIAILIMILIALFRFPFVRQTVTAKTISLPQNIKKGFIKFSLLSCANNSIARLFYNIDLYLIGLIIADVNIIAAYKVAMTIPFALTFITSSIVTYIYPKFVVHREDRDWLKKKYLILLAGLILINGIITILFMITSKWVIAIVFGSQYLEEALVPFNILMIGFFISSTFRIPAGNILDMLHLVTPNLIISLISGAANIILDYVLIKNGGANGAAIATSLIYLIYAILSNIIVILYIYDIKIMKRFNHK